MKKQFRYPEIRINMFREEAVSTGENGALQTYAPASAVPLNAQKTLEERFNAAAAQSNTVLSFKWE